MKIAIIVMFIFIIEVLRALNGWFGPKGSSDENDSDIEMTAFCRLEEESP